MDEVWQMGIIHTLNACSYIKAKNQHEKEMIKKWKDGVNGLSFQI